MHASGGEPGRVDRLKDTIPMRRGGSPEEVSEAFEFGRLDTPDAIKENFVKMSLGFTLNDSSWFFKRKFG